MIVIKRLENSDIARIAEIDRSEHVTSAYVYQNGTLEKTSVDWHVPPWFTDHDGDHSIAEKIRLETPILEEGGVLLGAFDGDRLAGMAVLRYRLTDTMAELALLHVSREYRRQGIAKRLTQEVCRLAKEDGAQSVYVSSSPSKPAVEFYLGQGFHPTEEVNPELYALEPDDIHMIKPL